MGHARFRSHVLLAFRAAEAAPAAAAPFRASLARSGALVGMMMVLFSGGMCTACKRADTEAAEAQVKTEAEFSRAYPQVLCLERLGRLALEEPDSRPWGELSADSALSLCRGATSTAPVDCLLESHELLLRAREEVPLQTHLGRPLETAARLCAPGAGGVVSGGARTTSCFVARVKEGNETALAVTSCRVRLAVVSALPSPACVARFIAGNEALRARGKTYSRAQIDALCAGVAVPARPFSCIAAFDGDASEAFVACRGNDDPGAPGCFRDARRLRVPFVTGKPGTTLSDAHSARLCSRPD